MDINQLLEDISIRHACKNVDKYVADVKKAIGIKLVPVGSSGLEFTWSKDFEWYTEALETRESIFRYFKQQNPKMFSIKDYNMSSRYTLSFTFTFHPENAV